MRKIFNYIVAIITISSLPYTAFAQSEVADSINLYRGFRVEIDILSPLMTSLGMSKGYYYQGGLQVNLKEKYFPTFEVGIGGINNKESATGIRYNTDGLYARVGVDYNLLKPKADKKAMNNVMLAGIRIGASSFTYDLTNVIIEDGYWGGQNIYDYTGVFTTRFWYEIVFGLRVEIFNNTFMGWGMRLKYLFDNNTDQTIYPYYIPGLGAFKGSHVEFNYSVGYQF